MHKKDSSERDGVISKNQLIQINNLLEKKICKINEKNITGFFCEYPFPEQFHLLTVLVTNALNKEDLQIHMQINLTLTMVKKKSNYS